MAELTATEIASNLDRKRLTSLINSMADGVLAIDSNYNIVIYNGGALNILNINTTITGQRIDSVLRLMDKHSQPVNLLETIRTAKTAYSTRDLAISYNDGSIVKLYLSIAPVHLGFGGDGAQGYVLLLRDITREKSLEEERDEFISVASHELRTPVAIAEGNISNAKLAVKRGGNPKLIEQSLDQAYDQIIFLSSLINDLSTLSRAEGGKLKAEVSEINATELVTELSNNYKGGAEQKGLQLLTQIDPGLEILKSSPLYVKEILENFVTNSIKYTQTGHVTLGAKPAEHGIDFWVEDTGIGISKTDQEKVFNKFFRSEDYRTRQNKGTGLGLYVSLKLAHLINAQLYMKSELNKGTRFSLHVPSMA